MANAGIPRDDRRIADCFLNSLTAPIQTIVRMTLVNYTRFNPDFQTTVESISEIARQVVGDDVSTYNMATSMLLPNLNFSSVSSGPRTHPNKIIKHHKGAKNFNKPFDNNRLKGNSVSGVTKYFCKQHGNNSTHSTESCFSLNKKTEAKKNNRCFKCNEPYTHGHRCTSFNDQNKNNNTDHMVLAVTSSEEKGAAKAESIDLALQKKDDKASVIDFDDDLDDMEFDCKHPNKEMNNNNDSSNQSNLNFNINRTPVKISGVILLGCCDTGAQTTIINHTAIKKKLDIKINKSFNKNLTFLNKNNSIPIIGRTEPLKVEYINGISFTHVFEVLEFDNHFDFDVLLGNDILPKLNISLEGIAYKPGRVEFTKADIDTIDDSIFENINHDFKEKLEADHSPAGTKEEIEQFMTLIKDVLDKNSQISETSSCPMEESIVYLPTPPNATAYRRQYPIPIALRPVLQEQIEKWLETGTIRKCKVNTSFNSPLLLVPKKNKEGQIVSHRVCLDVRMLNKILPPTFNYPVPLIKDIFAKLAGKKVFTTLDLTNAYHRFAVAESDQHKLTFTHLDGQQYCFKKACFGLKFLTSQFSKVLAILFDGLDCVQNFVDDAVIASDTLEQHIKDVRLVIDRLNSANLILNISKCSWAQQSVRLLGFIVDSNGTRVDKNKLTNVHTFRKAKTAKEVQSILGLVNYFRDYVPMMARVAEPLMRISHAHNVNELWGDEQNKSLDTIKRILQSNLVLSHADMSKRFYCSTDASQYAVSAVLFQKDEYGRDKYISFISCSLSPSQRNWSTTKRELYAVVIALRKFREYLYNNPFTLFTDHKALVYLHTQKNANNLLITWYDYIYEYAFDVVHIPGIQNRLADLLSRLYPPKESEHKLVEDKGKRNRRSLDKNRLAKNKRYSYNRTLNVLAMKAVQNKKKGLEYICPPDNERHKLLTDAHKLGHGSSIAVVRDLHDQGIHWTGIYEEAKALVNNCIECHKHNIVQRGYHPITNIVSLRPFDHVSIDLAGPLPMSSDGCIYILVVLCNCTKFVIIRGLKDKQSVTVAKQLIDIFGLFGFPRIINMDNGLEFKNAVMKHIADNLHIERRFSVPYHPQANPAESAVKRVMNTLRKMIQSNTRDWSVFLPIVQLCLNKQIVNRTLSAPFSLMFARRVNLPDDYANKEKYPIPDAIMSNKELEDRIDEMEKLVFPAIEERTKKINEMINKAYNEKHKLVNIPEGSFVMVRLPQRSNKLAAIYDGPYTVVRKTQGGSYILKTPETNELLPRNYTPSELKLVQIEEEAIEDFYEVEKILDHRGSEGNREFLVKWSNYSDDHNSWVKASDFSSSEMIQDYWDKYDKKNKNSPTPKTRSAKKRNNRSTKSTSNKRKLTSIQQSDKPERSVKRRSTRK